MLGPDMSIILPIGCVLLSIFGGYISYKIRRPMVFRVKLTLVYMLPTLLALLFIHPKSNIDSEYIVLMAMSFTFLLTGLYWREVKCLLTSAGYHKSVLVNFLDVHPDLVWMKDVDGNYTYTNATMRKVLLKCSEKEAFGKNLLDIIGVYHNNKEASIFDYSSKETDVRVSHSGKPERSMELGKVEGEFLALQVFKAPLFVTDCDGDRRMVGTIGLGRDLTYEYRDHEDITTCLKEGDVEGAVKVFDRHLARYECKGKCSLY